MKQYLLHEAVGANAQRAAGKTEPTAMKAKDSVAPEECAGLRYEKSTEETDPMIRTDKYNSSDKCISQINLYVPIKRARALK